MQTMQIRHISVLQTSKVTGVLYLVLGLIYIPLGWLADASASPDERLGVFWLLAPVFFALFGMAMIALLAGLYNFVAARMGGVEFSIATPSEPV